MDRRLIYTVITGDYDKPSKCPQYEGWDFLLITDNPEIEANGWPLKVVQKEDNPCKLQRYWKINSCLLEYPLTVYIDGNMTLKSDPLALVKAYFNGLLSLVKHPSRDCIIQESKAIIDLKKDKFEIVRNQVGRYVMEGIPFNFGMWAAGFIIRDNSIFEFEKIWSDELKKHSHRDQLSLPYALWKTGLKYNEIPWATLLHYVTIKRHDLLL